MPDRQWSRRSVLAAAGALAGAGCLDAEATPALAATDWPMFGGDPGRTGYAPEADPPRTEPEIAWEHTPDPASGRTPIVGNGTVYYQTSDRLFVVDLETGDATATGTYRWFEGSGTAVFAPSETYEDGMYVVPYGTLVAGHVADPDTWPAEMSDNGRPRRRWLGPSDGPVNADWGRVSSGSLDGPDPVAVDGRIVCEIPGGDRYHLTALDVDTGRARWTRGVDSVFEEQFQFSPPIRTVAADGTTGTVVASFGSVPRFDGGIVAFDLADGTFLWDRAVGRPGKRLALSDGTVFADVRTEDGHRLVALSLSDGATVWERDRETESGAPIEGFGLAVDEGRCYLTGTLDDADDGPLVVTAVDRTDGSTAWERQVGVGSGFGLGHAGQWPTVAGDVLLAPGGESVYAFDKRDGEQLWRFRETVPTSGGSESPRRPMTPVVPVGDRLVVAMTLALYGLEAP